MKITVLGCGCAGGVPLIGNNWGACDPSNPKNRRTRVSLKIEEAAQTFLVDTSPDLRQQLLSAGLDDLTAVFYTHEHADHTHGVDSIRSINWLTGHAIPVYANKQTMESLEKMFPYIFNAPPVENGRFINPSIEQHILNEEPLFFENIKVTNFKQTHGDIFSLGYRFNDFGYSTDVSALDEKAFEMLRGVKVWVVGAVRERPHPKHAHLAKVLEWIERIKPQRAYLTHMDQSMDYDTLKASLPRGVEPAYDGLVIEV